MLIKGLCASTLALLAACGSNNGNTDPGGGSGTLLVLASASSEGGNAQFRVVVSKLGAAVSTATVVVTSDLGTTTLVQQPLGVYTGLGAGWAHSYTVTVTSGDDNLHGTIDAPVAAIITAPNPAVAFDPHAAANGVVTIKWSGDAADTASVHTDNFDWGPEMDPGQLVVASSIFIDTSQDFRVDRQNKTILAGGIAGSQLTATIDTRTTLLVTNPFPH
jgi:hypothetical protein